jgi:hypothetical protein
MQNGFPDIFCRLLYVFVVKYYVFYFAVISYLIEGARYDPYITSDLFPLRQSFQRAGSSVLSGRFFRTEF